MRKHLGFVLAVVLAFTSSAFADNSLGIDVRLSPAGSFKAETTKVKGFAYKTEKGVAAVDIEIDVTSLSTGMSLRDKHLKERLEAEKHPVAKLIKATGQDGQGVATIEVKGVKKEVKGTYKIKGKDLEAQFKMNLSDLGINGVRYMSVGVKDEVVVTVQVPMKSERGAASAPKMKKKE